jgi:glycosyltransferase involved in cell wall biosynthesis
MKLPLISVIIPTFNQALYLEQAINSVLSQEYPAQELIIIDGGSTDGSLEIINKYRAQVSYWSSEPDNGQSHAINKGFSRCTGEIITFLSSDDYYLPGTFKDVANLYTNNPVTGALIGGFSFLAPGMNLPDPPIYPFLKSPAPLDLSLGPPGIYRLHQVATFYTRAALDTVGMRVREELRYVMDRELLYRVCREFPVTLSEKTYGVFRKHAESKSTADILPFAREFAGLYTMSCTGESALDKRRKKMARYRLSRGYLKHAEAALTKREKYSDLINAARLYPSLLTSKGYLKRYIME